MFTYKKSKRFNENLDKLYKKLSQNKIFLDFRLHEFESQYGRKMNKQAQLSEVKKFS